MKIRSYVVARCVSTASRGLGLLGYFDPWGCSSTRLPHRILQMCMHMAAPDVGMLQHVNESYQNWPGSQKQAD